jgi:hypothetical protein
MNTTTAASTPTINILGRLFAITSAIVPPGRIDAGTVQYTLTGPRSAVYVTNRNVHSGVLFLVNKRTGKVLLGEWFSDATGSLRPVYALR